MTTTAGRRAVQALFCLFCLSLAVSLFWYTIGRDLPHRRWRLRLEQPLAAAPARQPSRLRPVGAVGGAGNSGTGGHHGGASPACRKGRDIVAECVASSRLFKDSGGGGGEWRVCTAGWLQPQSPCLAFAIGPDLEFDSEFALAYSCQVFNFHSAEHQPATLGDGLWVLGRLNETNDSVRTRGDLEGGSFRRLLRRLGAMDHIVELLRLRLRSGVPASSATNSVLDGAINDGSLANVKQLLLQMDELAAAPTEATIGRLAAAGFCPWRWMAETPGLQQQQQQQHRQTRLTLVNVRFLPAMSAVSSPLRHRNPPGSQIARPLEKLGLVEPLKDD